MLRLICVDVDGTLVGTSGTVLPEVWAAADRAKARGIRLAVCSGRPVFGHTRDLAARLDAEGWHVFQNGASVVHLSTGQSLSASLPPAAVEVLVERSRSSGRLLELYTDSDYAVEKDDPEAREHARLLGVPFAPRPFEALQGSVVRAQWLLTKDQVHATLNEPHDGLELVHSTAPLMPRTTFVMFTPIGISKASGVRAVAAHYGVPLSDVMVVGDGHNDIQAMQAVGFPVAMGNAAPEVRDAARLQVGHVDAGGLAEALDLAFTG
jgi:Cof subfamily protein (haloacid dehalogenase superfamily)